MFAFAGRVLDAILGRVPGKPGRYDTATRMAMDADFRRPSATRGESRAVNGNVDSLREIERLTREKAPGH
jgi:hypothetical protein